MAYENETQEVILDRMLDGISDLIDKRQGSVVYDLLAPSALELAQAYLQLENVLNFGFLSDNTPSNFIDLRVAEIGLTRKPAAKAVGSLTFSGTNGIVIPADTRVSSDEAEPKYFVTTQAATITNGTATVQAEAEIAGESGNVTANKITIALGNVSGVASVNNPQAFDGGTDEESDESLLIRYFEKVQNPPTSGNASHYKQWAKSVPGISEAKVYPLWNGNGTVKVVLLDEEKTAPPAQVVDDVTALIENERPVGASVTVVAAVEVPINVNATISLKAGATLSDAITEFTELLAGYLKTLAFVDQVVRYAKIASLLFDCPSVVDYANLTVNGTNVNVTVADGDVAVAGTVTFA